MAVIAIPRPLREKLGEDGADALVAVLNEAAKNQREDIVSFVAERFERRLAEELAKVREEIAALRVQGANDKAELKVEIARVRADLVRWMFVFWVGQIGVITGILFAFFK